MAKIVQLKWAGSDSYPRTTADSILVTDFEIEETEEEKQEESKEGEQQN